MIHLTENHPMIVQVAFAREVAPPHTITTEIILFLP